MVSEKRVKPNVELIDSTKKRDLEAHRRFLENENVKLLGQINESSTIRKLSFFENGQYTHNMFLETRVLSQTQLASILTENTDDNLTLYSDGISKHGHSYTTLDVKKGDNVIVLGLREVGRG